MKQINVDIVQSKPDIQVEMSVDKPTIQVGIEQPTQIINRNYNELDNKPSINNVVLQGNKTGDDLGLTNKDVFEAETNKLQENINKETARAKEKENALETSIDDEANDRASADTALSNSISAESTRATNAEAQLRQQVLDEESARKTEDFVLRQEIANEESARKSADDAFTDLLNAEIARATNKESALQTNIDNEAKTRQTVDELLDKSIKTVAQGLLDETAERKQQDEIIQANLNAHINDTSNPHKVTKQQVGLGSVDNTSDMDKPVSIAQAAAIQHVQDNVDEQCGDIQKLIPTQASAENQLADKDFVNSSIQNMAAFYITKDVNGNPFGTHAELIAGPYYFQGKVQAPSINDYAIVLRDETKTPDALGQYPTTRYMYDGTQWAFQYIVNNTPLTAAQVAAINSGATKELIDSIPNKYVKPAAGIPKSDLANDVQIALGLAETAVQSFEAEATIDDTTGTPTVDVEKSGEPTSPTYTFIFKHLKGMPGKDGKDGKDGGQGPQGPQGVGVKSITSGTPTVVNDKTNTPITVTLTDNTTVDLVVSAENGKDGTSATVDIVQTTGQSTTDVMSQKAVTDELNTKANSADLSAVATSGNYNELSNKPVINADLDNTAASTADQTVLYHHVGESTATYKKAALYYTDGTNWLQFKGEKGNDGAAGKNALVYNKLTPTLAAGSRVIYFNSDFNRFPVEGEKVVLFSVGNQYALCTVFKTDGTYATLTVDSIVITKGSKGADGLTALEYGDTYTEEYEGDIADESISLPISGFNRTPVVGDKFLLVYNVTESGNTYVAPFTITEVATDTAKASIDGAFSPKISGDKGADGAQTVVYNGNDIIEVSSVAKGATFSLATSLLTGANTIKVGDSCILPLATSTEDEGLKYGCQITAISNGIATLKIVDGFPTQSRMIYGGAVSKFDAPITLTLAELLGAQFSWGMSIISIGDLSAGTMKIGNVPITEEDGTIIIYRVNGSTLIQKPNSALVIAEQAENITFEGVMSYEMSRYSLVFNMNWEL